MLMSEFLYTISLNCNYLMFLPVEVGSTTNTVVAALTTFLWSKELTLSEEDSPRARPEAVRRSDLISLHDCSSQGTMKRRTFY